MIRRQSPQAYNQQTLIDSIYEAAVVPSQWPSVLDELAGLGDGVGGLLFSMSQGDLRWFASPVLQEGYAQYLADGWPTRTDRLQRLLAARHSGFLDDLDVYTPEELEREPVFTEFLRPRGLGRGAATAIPVPSGDMLVFDIERNYLRGPLVRPVLARLDELRPHLARAALISARLRVERARSVAAALELVGLPAAILGLRGQVVALNGLFEQLIPSVVRDQRDRLVLADAAVDTLFVRALHEMKRGNDLDAVRSLPVAAARERPPLIVHMLPVRGAAQDVFGGAGSVVVVTPVQPRDVPTAEVLEGLFDLTPAEARVARAVAAASRLSDIAAGLGTSEATVRSQLQAVFGKTGVGRQAELVALLAGLSISGQELHEHHLNRG